MHLTSAIYAMGCSRGAGEQSAPTVCTARADSSGQERADSSGKEEGPPRTSPGLRQVDGGNDVNTESVDSAWAPDAEMKIQKAIKDGFSSDPSEGTPRNPSEVTLSNVYCRTTRCVVEGSAANKRALQAFYEKMMPVEGVPRTRLRAKRERDGFSFKMILAREGYDVDGTFRTSQGALAPR